jgi:RNA polymerase sigma-70 factor, ECF subfamily
MSTSASVDAAWRSHRPYLVNVAYQMLGDVGEAEDIAQEAFLRLARTDLAQIDDVRAWLTVVAGRLCLDQKRSARARYEHADDSGALHTAASAELEPADRVTLDDEVRTALLEVLRRLSPGERVAFVLHDVFGYPYADIAAIVGRSPHACRQLASSARRRTRLVSSRRPPTAEHAQLVAAFKRAWEAGDVATLVGLLDPAVTAVTDGGGVVSAALEPVTGAEAVARFLLDVRRRQPDLTIHETTVNGRPGLVTRAGGDQLAVIAVEPAGGRVERLWVVRNPAKLTAWRAAAGSR